MLIAGAGNLGLHTLDQLLADHYSGQIVFFDEKGRLPPLIDSKYRVIGSVNEIKKYFGAGMKEFIVTLGQPRLRERLTKRISDAGGELSSLFSNKTVFISAFSSLGAGTIIQPGCAISHNAVIGKSCILHASTLVGHDVEIRDYVTIGSMVNILKGVKVGQYTTIGPSVVIYQNIRIGCNAYIAPGITVTKDVGDNETVSL